MPSFKLKSSLVTILQGVEFSIFPLILAWALQQFSATALPVITVKFQIRSSINVRLTKSFLYNKFCIERSPKMGFWGDFRGKGEDIWWECTSVLRIVHFQTFFVQI